MASDETILDFLFSALRRRAQLSVSIDNATTLLFGVYCIAVSDADGRVVFGDRAGATASTATVETNVARISDAWESTVPRVPPRGY